MANGAHGNVDIGLDIDTKPAAKALDNFKKKLNSAFTSTDTKQLEQNIKQTESNIKKLQTQIEKTRDKLKELSKGDTQPKSVIAMEKELEKAMKDTDTLAIKLEKLQNQRSVIQQKGTAGRTSGDDVQVGGKYYSPKDAANLKTLNSQIEQTTALFEKASDKLDELEPKLRQLKSNPELTDEAKKYNKELDDATKELEDEKQKLDELKSKQAQVNKETSKHKEHIKQNTSAQIKQNKASSKSIPILGSIGQMFSKIGKMAKRVFIFSVITSALRGLKSALGSIIKADSQLSSSLAQIKGNLLTAFAPIWQIIKPALAGLLNILNTVTAALAKFISMITGKSISASKQAAKALNSQAQATKNTSKATKEATKTLLAFDELNQLDDQTKGTEGSGASDIVASYEGLDKAIDTTIFDDLQEKLDPVRKSLENLNIAMKPFKTFVWTGLQSFYNQVLVPIGNWTLGEGLPRFIDGITTLMNNVDWTSLNTSLDTFFGYLGKATLFTFDTILDFYERVLVPIGSWVIGEAFPRFVDCISDTLAKVDFDKLNSALERLYDAVASFGQTIGEGLLWFWENPISYLITFFSQSDGDGNSIISLSIDAIANAIKLLDEIIQAAMNALQWIWDNFFVPIGDWLWEQTIEFLKGLVSVFGSLSDWATENPETLETISTIIIGFLSGMWFYNSTVNIIDFITKLISTLKKFGGLKGTLTALGNAINSPALAIGALTAAALYWVENWDKIKAAFEGMSGWEKVATVVLALAAAIAVLWVAVSAGAAAAGIVAGLALLGLGAGILAVDKAKTKKASKTGGGSGGSSGGGTRSIPSMQSALAQTVPSKSIGGYKIPALARGAVLPPNQPFLSIVGDQKRGTNIEAPLSTIQEALSNELDKRSASTNQEITINFTGNLSQLARVLNPVIEKEKNRVGTKLVKGGAY